MMANPAEYPKDLAAYCVMCRTGAERTVCQAIARYAPDVQAIFPRRVIEEKRQQQWQAIERPLLPGYVFLYSQTEIPHDLMRKVSKAYKVLYYERGCRSLLDEDLAYARWIYRHIGLIAPSTVLAAGQTIQVIDGPLLDATGTIVRLDKRHRRAWVSFTFDGEQRTVSLSANCLEALPEIMHNREDAEADADESHNMENKKQ